MLEMLINGFVVQKYVSILSIIYIARYKEKSRFQQYNTIKNMHLIVIPKA